MGNCLPSLRKKKEKSVSEILSQSCSPGPDRPSSKLEDEMGKELSLSEFDSRSSAIEEELGNISETMEYTEVHEIHLERPGFSYIIGFTEGKPDQMPSRFAERAKSRFKMVRSALKITEEDEGLMDEILREADEKERIERELEERQQQAMSLREAHLNDIREKAMAMRMKA